MATTPFWSRPASDVIQGLNSTASGLSAAAAQAALARVGPNRIQSEARITPIGMFLNQFKSPIVLMLIAATIISAFLQDWVDAVIILLIVVGSALLSFYQEYSANTAAEKLKEQVSFKTDVLRDGRPVSVATADIVPGDVVLLSAGSLIPADGLVLEARDFFVNQAVLTGETSPVEKMPGVVAEIAGLAERTNVVFMGANVRSGSARALIVQTGLQTAFGEIAGRLTLRPPETEFEHGIRQQILLINFLTDLPEMTIAGDRVDEAMLDRPHRMDIKYIRRFMLIFGPLSSLFDYATFGVLFLVMKAGQQSFQTGWLIESILSAGVVVFAVRTRLPFLRSRPSRAMLAVTAAVMLVTLALPYSPLAGVLGLTPLSLPYRLIIFGIVALYFTAAELTNRWFYRRYGALA